MNLNRKFDRHTQGVPNIKDLIRKQKSLVMSPESRNWIDQNVRKVIGLDDLEIWLHESYEKAEKDNNYAGMKQYAMTNDLISNILIQYTMDKYPGKIVWLDPTTGNKVE